MLRHHRGNVQPRSTGENLNCVCVSVCVWFVTPALKPDFLDINPHFIAYHLGDHC